MKNIVIIALLILVILSTATVRAKPNPIDGDAKDTKDTKRDDGFQDVKKTPPTEEWLARRRKITDWLGRP
jgi:hypothetical protein